MNVFDELELTVLEQTGDMEQAQEAGHVAREVVTEVNNLLAYLLGLGPVFVAELEARLR